MNNPTIKTYTDLLQEKQRLKLLLSEREMEVRKEFADIKRKFAPVTKVVNFIEKLTTKDGSNPLLNTGIDVGVNLLIRKVILRNAGWIVKLVTPFLLKNFLSHQTKEHPEWMQKLVRFFKKTFTKEPA